MIDQLIKLVEQNAGEAIVKNQAIPNQFNNAAIQDVAEQTLANNPMVKQIISNIAANFGSKFGVSPQVAQSIASGLIPQVLNQFVNKTNDPNDKDFDLQDMMRGFSGNSSLNINDILGQVTGNKSNQGLGGVGDVLGKLFGK